MPLIVCAAVPVMKSVLEVPTSAENTAVATVVVGAVVSTTIAAALGVASETLPAASVWRTFTAPLAYVPADNVKLVPAPAAQFIPTSVLYSQVASPDRPVTLTRPSLVLPSVPKLPLSSTSPKAGIEGICVSTLNVREAARPTLPAASRATTVTVSEP